MKRITVMADEMLNKLFEDYSEEFYKTFKRQGFFENEKEPEDFFDFAINKNPQLFSLFLLGKIDNLTEIEEVNFE